MSPRNPRTALRSQLRIQQLHMLLRLIECGTVRGAAEELALSQSAVTKSLKELETLLGAKLFERHARGLRPTVFCAPVEEFARATLLGLDGAVESMMSLVAGHEGRVAIGVNGGWPERWLLEGMQQIRDAFPRLTFYQESDRSPNLTQRLESGEIDFALMALSRHSDSAHLGFLPLGGDPLVVVAPHEHPLAMAGRAELPELLKATWVLPPVLDPAREALAFALLALGHQQPQAVIETRSDELALRLAVQQQLVTLVPRDVLDQSPLRNRLCDLRTPLGLPVLRYGFVRHRERELRPGASAVLMQLQRRLREQRNPPASNSHGLADVVPLVGSR